MINKFQSAFKQVIKLNELSVFGALRERL